MPRLASPRLSRRRFLLTPAAALAAADAGPAPYGALPSARQLRWHELEFYGFVHFSINTFTGREWGYGDEDPALFNPTAFDPDALVSVFQAAGMKGVILTCKHHDGFCLWPTRTTSHNIAKSPWKGGKGDMVAEFAQAARRHGMKFGVYLSPWDRNHPEYARPGYITAYREQLRELLTGYGPIFEVWFDGANGGDGYYGGAREKRVIDRRAYYGWPATWELVRSLQPDAVIFSDVGPDVRWVGNERGYAAETSWATYDPAGIDGGPAAPGYSRYKEAATGHRNGSRWLPAECDVSIRPGWFWREHENARVKTPAQLFDLYCRSVGRGASFLLNVPPDRRGLFHENDVAALRGLGEILKKTFGRDLAAGAFRPRAGEGARKPEVTLELERPIDFNTVRLREDIRFGQRIEAFELDAWSEERWQPFAKGSSVGACRIVRAETAVTTNRVRLRVTQSPVPPVLSELGPFLAPA